MNKPCLLQTGQMMPLIERQLADVFAMHCLTEAPGGTGLAKRRDGLIERIGGDVEAIATGSHTGVKVDAAMIARFPKLKIIANFGVGYDTVDVAAAGKRGIIVTNTPDVLTEEVADTAIGLLIMTVRELGHAERYLRAGCWAKEGDYRLTPGSLRDRKLGMVGMGRIGQAIAKRAAAFGMPISYFARSKRPGVTYPYHASVVDLAKAVDTLLVITPGGAATRNMIDAKVLAALGPRGVLINMARGTVVDEPALVAALQAKTILAAGLDVYAGEPNVSAALLALPNATLLPHVGSASQFTRDGMAQLVVDNLVHYARRQPPANPVPETPFKGW